MGLSQIWQNGLFLFWLVDVHVGPNVTRAVIQDLLIISVDCIVFTISTFTALPVPVKIFDFDSGQNDMDMVSVKQTGLVSSGNMGGRTGQPLLKSFSITEEREAIVL